MMVFSAIRAPYPLPVGEGVRRSGATAPAPVLGAAQNDGLCPSFDRFFLRTYPQAPF